jgi:hypothetical protein
MDNDRPPDQNASCPTTERSIVVVVDLSPLDAMPIDLAKQFIFVHIPKTGGTSIELMFDLRDPGKFYGVSSEIWPNRSLQHLRWLELKACLPETFVEAAYTFSFVRNPWDRFVSEYFWRKRWFERDLATRGPQHGQGWFYTPDRMQSLDAFADLLQLPIEQRLEDIRGFDGHLETQLSFVADEHGRIMLDHVGRFETFESDVRTIAQSVGKDLGPILHRQSSIRDRDYRIYYSGYARDAVAEFYRDDIQAFGYTF